MLSLWLGICLSLSFMFMQLATPLSLGAIVVVFSFFVSVSMVLICSTPWFSFLLFMLFLSGMMIIFIYVSSLASNELYFYSPYFFILVLLCLSPVLLKNETNKLMNMSDLSASATNNYFIMYKAYSFSVCLFTMLLIIYLLITLIVVVKNSTMEEAPLRAKK
uniref:NADH dehydrogenase subunit 6 n=1 Tax=Hyalella sp. n. 1 FZ-2021 TaxID=2803338 RepID=A0A7T8ZSG4_9CRUS|nr:NADH dehydrogenase subunit 6 [Hyalella sp. n. 1 FZ-2021]